MSGGRTNDGVFSTDSFLSIDFETRLGQSPEQRSTTRADGKSQKMQIFSDFHNALRATAKGQTAQMSLLPLGDNED